MLASSCNFHDFWMLIRIPCFGMQICLYRLQKYKYFLSLTRICVCKDSVIVVVLPLGDVLHTFRSVSVARPDLRNGSVFVSDVIVEVIAWRADELDGIVSHFRYQFHSRARDGMAREVEVVDSAAAVPVAPILSHSRHMLLAELLHSFGAHALVYARTSDRHRHEEEIGLGSIGCHEWAFH